MEEQRAVERAVAYAISHGVVMAAPSSARVDSAGEGWTASRMAGTAVVHAPFTLRPSKVPADAFQRARALTPLLNQLVHKISLDYDFLLE